ncbi:respiratory nitrate reductase chaperone NarJ [Tistlia consotensis]|uniref:Respiratory nitrate reductase chaperone NarJ n=1 Tax=Tistlia consotensis USBA 355 TaxID=560819 RepID=A0A1Y6BAV4_9PROT|nr:nitrate reductase molybdenum cofactor assembly chaperone [Tistlia consotensis]SMF01973.1 respiratory nitrate reductase chaperone NarJ [Tistlia consotensis USBA 355]SNS26101.1 respiratory nitrate reductase chaperone NarJ [Tistlia consotensis]
MTVSLKVLSLLLSYPSDELQQAAPELRAALAGEGLLDAAAHPGVYALIDQLAGRELLDLQERYVLLFDRTRSLSLHLFEHVHGESRDRGQALVDLQALYAEHGLVVEAKELPDYLPLFLEFLSTRPLGEARGLLAQPLHVLTALRERLVKRGSDYAAVFAALEALADGAASAEDLAAARAEPDDDPTDLAALDRDWEEAAVTFGPGLGGPGDAGAGQEGCPKAEAMLKQMGADAAAAAPRSR